MGIVRIGKMFNRRDQKKGLDQKGIFDVARAKGYRHPDQSFRTRFISGTDVPRLRPMHLGVKSVGVSEDEIQRVVLALQHFYASKAAQRVSSDKKPRHTAPSERPTSARSPMSECLSHNAAA